MNATMNPAARAMRFCFFALLVFLFVLWGFYHFLSGMGLGLDLGLEWYDLDWFLQILIFHHFETWYWPALSDFVMNPEHSGFIAFEIGIAFVVGLFFGWLQDFLWKAYLKNHMRN